MWIQTKLQKCKTSKDAELLQHGFEHDSNGKSSSGLEKQQKKTGGQYIPAAVGVNSRQ
jgi:hypothetical protein